MTAQATQAQPLALDPFVLAGMIRATMDTLPHHPDAAAEEQAADRHAAFTIIAALRPRDPLEAMLAARIAATHFHIMDDLRCAAQRDLPPALKVRHRRSAVALTRMQEATQRELTRRQAFPALQPAALPAAMPAPRPQRARRRGGATSRDRRLRCADLSRGRAARGRGGGQPGRQSRPGRSHGRAAPARARRPCGGVCQGARSVIGREDP